MHYAYNCIATPMPPSRLSPSKLPLAPEVLLVLLVLADEPAHGYAIRQRVIERSDGAVDLDPGSLYRLIARLADDGLVDEASRDEESRRRTYRLTPRGRRVLAAELDRLRALLERAASARKRPRYT
jgi:DNA-binding PadR family transcriptional regulator